MPIIHEPSDFRSWCRKKKKRYLALVVGLMSVLHVLGIKEVSSTLPALQTFLNKYSGLIPHVSHLLVIIFVLSLVNQQPPIHSCSEYVSSRTALLRATWKRVWLVWLFLYLVFAFRATLELLFPSWQQASPDIWKSAWGCGQNFLKNVQGGLFVALYVQLLGAKFVRDGLKEKPTEGDPPYFLLFAIAVLAAALEGITIFLWGGSDQRYWASLVSGLWPAVGLALVTGRLESKLVNLPNIVIVLLYLYAILQPAFAGTQEPYPRVFVILVLSALLLKILLFVVMHWFLTSGRVLFYYSKLEDIGRVVEKQWSDFKQTYIEGKHFAPKNKHYNIFLSAPMRSLPPEVYFQKNDEVCQLVDAIENLETYSVFYAGKKVGRTNQFEDAGRITRNALEHISRSSLFVLVHNHSVLAGSLVEAGIALGLYKPILVFAQKEAAKLSFAEPSEHRTTAIHIVEYESMSELIKRVPKEWNQYIQILTSKASKPEAKTTNSPPEVPGAPAGAI